MTRLVIVIPVFNDWDSLQLLLRELDDLEMPEDVSCTVLAVNDASTAHRPPDWLTAPLQRIVALDVVNLACNLGHQRAIAVGLVVAATTMDCDISVVMDGDGEDLPADVRRLVAASRENPGRIVCAERTRRSESLAFRVGYTLYKCVFRFLTGAKIDFGNFCLLPSDQLGALTRNSGIWNHLAATIVRSRTSRLRLPTARGTRYTGHSKMNFISLVLHGLSALSVFSDVALVRVLVVSVFLGLLTLGGLASVTGVRLFTELAIPGWASTVAGALLVILIQAVVLITVSTFSLLHMRSAKTVVPLLDAQSFIESHEHLLGPSRRDLPRRA